MKKPPIVNVERSLVALEMIQKVANRLPADTRAALHALYAPASKALAELRAEPPGARYDALALGFCALMDENIEKIDAWCESEDGDIGALLRKDGAQ